MKYWLAIFDFDVWKNKPDKEGTEKEGRTRL